MAAVILAFFVLMSSLMSIQTPLEPKSPVLTSHIRSGGKWHVARIATWYGPGLYGNRTACGQHMSKYLLGVASRTLACGTKVQLRWHGHEVTVEVLDRGPYPAEGLRSSMPLDLTAGTAKRLGGYFTRHNLSWRVKP